MGSLLDIIEILRKQNQPKVICLFIIFIDNFLKLMKLLYTLLFVGVVCFVLFFSFMLNNKKKKEVFNATHFFFQREKEF